MHYFGKHIQNEFTGLLVNYEIKFWISQLNTPKDGVKECFISYKSVSKSSGADLISRCCL